MKVKILTTQIRGLLERIGNSQEEAVEETARLFAQALVGEGRIILAPFGEMAAVAAEALHGAEPLERAVRYEDGLSLTAPDRVWLIVRNSDHAEANELANKLSEEQVPFAVLAADSAEADSNELAELAFTYISTGLNKGLLPGPDGGRVVQPHALAALFVYEAVKLSMAEMLED